MSRVLHFFHVRIARDFVATVGAAAGNDRMVCALAGERQRLARTFRLSGTT
jgi:hypothetical protein